MKKFGTLTLILTLALVATVSFVGCSKKEKDNNVNLNVESSSVSDTSKPVDNPNILADFADCEDEFLASLVNNKDLPEETMTKIAISNGYKDLYSMEEDLRAKGLLERVPVSFILWGKEYSTYKYDGEISTTYRSKNSEYYSLYLDSLK